MSEKNAGGSPSGARDSQQTAALVVPQERARASGGQSIFSAEKAALIIEALLVGAFQEQVADYAGIDRKTLYRWITRGKELCKAKRALTKDEAALASFYLEVTKANAVFELKALEEITKSKDWKAAAWRLERKFSDRWGDRKHVTIEGAEAADERLRRKAASLAAGAKAASEAEVSGLYGEASPDPEQDGPDRDAEAESASAPDSGGEA